MQTLPKAIALSAIFGAFLFVLANQEARASREVAGRHICGQYAVHEWISETTLTCTPRSGMPYKVSEVTQ
jgi:hypothetical protein